MSKEHLHMHNAHYWLQLLQQPTITVITPTYSKILSRLNIRMLQVEEFGQLLII